MKRVMPFVLMLVMLSALTAGCVDIHVARSIVTAPDDDNQRITNQLLFSESRDFTFQVPFEEVHISQGVSVKENAESINIYITVRISPEIIKFVEMARTDNASLENAISGYVYHMEYQALDTGLKNIVDSLSAYVRDLADSIIAGSRFVKIIAFKPDGVPYLEREYNSTVVGDALPTIMGPMSGSWTIAIDAQGVGLNENFHDSFSVELYAKQPADE